VRSSLVDNAVFRLTILLDSFQRYSRSKSKFVRNRAVSVPPKIMGGGRVPQNVYSNYHTRLEAHHVLNSGEVICTDPKFIRRNTLNFVPIFFNFHC